MKKTNCVGILLVLILLFSLIAIPVFAWEPEATFYTWHSNVNEIASFSNTSLRCYFQAASFPYAELLASCSDASSAWSSFCTSTGATPENYHILFSDITREQAEENGISSEVVAFTSNTYSSSVDIGVNGQRGTWYTISRAQIWMIYDENSADYSADQLKGVAAHEWGHAIGYLGHDVYATQTQKAIMTPTTNNLFAWGVYGPQSRDIEHMRNVYP